MERINVGCGQTPIQGWRNYDNSLSVRLARHKVLAGILGKLGVLENTHREYIEFAKGSEIYWADASKKIPLPDNSVEVLYSSHMLEHLDKEDAKSFLMEAHRVLCPGGIIRIVVPDINHQAKEYLSDGDAEAFISITQMTRPRLRRFSEKLRFLIAGERHHLWMYDSNSLARFFNGAGFEQVKVLPPGETTIPEPGNLNLQEREVGSVYLEAVQPS